MYLMGVQIPPWEGAIFRGKGASRCKVWGHSAVICAKTAEPNQMPFWLWAGIDRRSHVLDGGPAMLRDVAMATNFGTQFAITGFWAITLGV